MMWEASQGTVLVSGQGPNCVSSPSTWGLAARRCFPRRVSFPWGLCPLFRVCWGPPSPSSARVPQVSPGLGCLYPIECFLPCSVCIPPPVCLTLGTVSCELLMQKCPCPFTALPSRLALHVHSCDPRGFFQHHESETWARNRVPDLTPEHCGDRSESCAVASIAFQQAWLWHRLPLCQPLQAAASCHHSPLLCT